MILLKAIDTSYNGYLFRSRLEARWAVFMDAIGVRYEYEAEGFDLGDGLYYLPDFWIPHIESWLEIKPSGHLSKEDNAKIDELVKQSGRTVYIQQGIHPVDRLESSPDEFGIIKVSKHGPYIDLDGKHCDGNETCEDCGYLWCECPHCGRHEIQFNGRADRIKCKCPRSDHGDKGYNSTTPKLLTAHSLALSYRF